MNKINKYRIKRWTSINTLGTNFTGHSLTAADAMTPTLVEGVGTYSKGRSIPGEAEGILEAIGGSTVSARSHQSTSSHHTHAGRVS